MVVKRDLEQVANAVLKPVGFRKKGVTWHRDGDGIWSVVNLQIEPNDSFCFVNIGFSVKSLQGGLPPKEHECHVRLRADRLFVKDGIDKSCFELDSPKDHESHLREIKAAFGDCIAPFLTSIVSLNDLRRLVQSIEWSRKLFILKVAWEDLGISRSTDGA